MDREEKVQVTASISKNAADRLEMISQNTGYKKSYLIHLAILWAFRNPRKINFREKIKDPRKTIILRIPKNTRDLLKKFKKSGISMAQFINAIILAFSLDIIIPEENIIPADIKEPAYPKSQDFQNQNKELFLSLNASMSELENVLKIFTGKKNE